MNKWYLGCINQAKSYEPVAKNGAESTSKICLDYARIKTLLSVWKFQCRGK